MLSGSVNIVVVIVVVIAIVVIVIVIVVTVIAIIVGCCRPFEAGVGLLPVTTHYIICQCIIEYLTVLGWESVGA